MSLISGFFAFPSRTLLLLANLKTGKRWRFLMDIFKNCSILVNQQETELVSVDTLIKNKIKHSLTNLV